MKSISTNPSLLPKESTKFPCPCCGFLVFSEPPGSYEICTICGWEDDAVQAANPCTSGGANGESLATVQEVFETTTPLADLAEYESEGCARDANWRVLTMDEKDVFRQESANGRLWSNPAIATVDEYYWRRNIVREKT